MIENFSNIYFLILYVVFLCLVGFYTYITIFSPAKLASDYNLNKNSVYFVRILGTFITAIFIIGITILFRDNGPEGTWIFFYIIFLAGVFQFIYETLFYLKLIDKDIEAKNKFSDIIISIIFVGISITLIFGLSDKIYN